jgi:hypothetical protein
VTDYIDVDSAFSRALAVKAEEGELHALFAAGSLANAEEATEGRALGPRCRCSARHHGHDQLTGRLGRHGVDGATVRPPAKACHAGPSSRGRDAWNALRTIVPGMAGDFCGRVLPKCQQRHDPSAKFGEMLLRLRESRASSDTVVGGNTIFTQPSQVAPIDHIIKRFQVKGLSTVPRTPQGRLALSQAAPQALTEVWPLSTPTFSSQRRTSPARRSIFGLTTSGRGQSGMEDAPMGSRSFQPCSPSSLRPRARRRLASRTFTSDQRIGRSQSRSATAGAA